MVEHEAPTQGLPFATKDKFNEGKTQPHSLSTQRHTSLELIQSEDLTPRNLPSKQSNLGRNFCLPNELPTTNSSTIWGSPLAWASKALLTQKTTSFDTSKLMRTSKPSIEEEFSLSSGLIIRTQNNSREHWDCFLEVFGRNWG